MGNTNVTKDAVNKTLIMERVFDAPRDQVWAAWADPRQLAQWWGPRGWETTIKEFNFTPGGAWLYCMKCVDKNQGEFYGQEAWGKGIYENIDEPEMCVYKDYFSDVNGTINKEMPATTVKMQFIDMGDQTKLVSHSVFDSDEGYEKVIAMGVVEGATETWDRLEEFVANDIKHAAR